MAGKHNQQDPMGVFHNHAMESTYYKPVDKGGVEISGPGAIQKAKDDKKKKKPKKQKIQKKPTENTDTDKSVIESVPRSLVFHRSTIPIGKYLKKLEDDVKNVMLPYTALKTEVSSKASFKDIVTYATKVWITHFLIFSITEISPILKIAKLPHGPTLTFRIKEYSTSNQLNDLRSSLKRSFGLDYTHYTEAMKEHPPLVILNRLGDNYSKDKPYLKIVQSTLQHMFPPLDIDKFHLNNRRVVLFEYQPDTETIEWRHYAVTTKSNNEEEKSDENSNLPEETDKTKKQIALEEIGPRLTLELYKIESEFMEGDILYHSTIRKSKEEEEEIKNKKQQEKKEKEERRKEQESNVQKKKDLQEKLKVEKLEKAELSLKRALQAIEEEKADENENGLDAIADKRSLLHEAKKSNKKKHEDKHEKKRKRENEIEQIDQKQKKKRKNE